VARIASSCLADSRLANPRVAWAALTGVGLLFVAGILALAATVPDDPRFWGVFATGWLLAALASIPAVLLIAYLDRRDPEPAWVGALAYFWGALIATGLGLVIRVAAIGPISQMFDETAGLFDTTKFGVQIVDRAVVFEWLETALVAPFAEEAIKALALLVLLFLAPQLLGSVRDGIVYGALVGLGFAVAETALYIGAYYVNAGLTPFLSQLIPRFVFGGINGHAIYSALFGAAVGLAIETERGSSVRKILLVLGGFLLAVSAHLMANAFGPSALVMMVSLLGIDPGVLTITELWFLSALRILLTNGWAYLVIGYLVVRSGYKELEVIRTELIYEVPGAATQEEYDLLDKESIWRLRRIPEVRRRVSMSLVRHQNRLALFRHRLELSGRPLDGDVVLAGLRADIATIRVKSGLVPGLDHGD
jgi:RsiW-degrading membrane proteinase PrsW (M82 family)